MTDFPAVKTSGEPDETDETLPSLITLAESLDAYSSDIPGFLNDLLSPHVPDAGPASQNGQPAAGKIELGPLDKTLNELLTRLSLLSQDTDSALEQSIHDISRTVPRLTYDLQFMREIATSLQGSLGYVQQQVSRNNSTLAPRPPTPKRTSSFQRSIDGPEETQDSQDLFGSRRNGGSRRPSNVHEDDETKTFVSLEKLAYLDKLKTRMESARDVLREAESWSTLESEIISFISSSSWSKAGIRLAEANKSMVVFQNTPGEYETKKTLLTSLTNELENALASALNQCLESGDVEGCAKLRSVFELIERAGEFRNYYFAQRRKPLVEEWNQAVILDTTSAADTVTEGVSPQRFSALLPRFYGNVLTALQTERDQITQIFPVVAAPSTLVAFLQSTFNALSPSLQSRLGALVDYHGAEGLPELIKAYKATEELAVGIQGVLDRMAFNTQGGLLSGENTSTSPNAITSPASIVTPEAKTPKTARHRSLSRRLSKAPTSSLLHATDSRSSTMLSTPSEWETTLFEPFLDLQATYPSLERRYLAHLLHNDPSLSAAPTASSSKSSRTDESRALMEQANAAFVIAEEAIARCVDLTHGFGARGLVDTVGGFFDDFLDLQQDKILSQNSRTGTASRSRATNDELDFEGLDYSTEDWGAFQVGLHVLKTCKDIKSKLIAFEDRLHDVLADIHHTVNFRRTDTTSITLTETTLGAITLLQQSPLNSADLHSLLSGISGNSTTTRGSSSKPLAPARDALTRFTKQAQQFLQSIILAPLQSQLDSYPSLPVWSQPEKQQKRGELQIPTFSLSTTDTVARVSEGLLNLLRIFEVYAKDEGLGYSVDTLPFVDMDLIREEEARAKITEKGDDTEANGGMSTGASATSIHSQTPKEKAAGETELELSPEIVLTTWVSSLSLSLLSHLTRRILPRIRTLTNGGSAQLSSDLGYLSNAVRALDVEWEELERWREVCEIKTPEEWRGKAKDFRGDRGDEAEDIWRKVGALRGWS